MESSDLSEILSIESPGVRLEIDRMQAKLEVLPDTYYALFWLYTHEFLYVSKSIEKILGHPYDKFIEHGMIFFQTIIPPRLISFIYKTMNAQAARIENHPDYLLAKEYLHVEAAVYNSLKEEVPVSYNAILLDVKPYTPTSYLVLCSWTDKRNKNKEQILEEATALKDLLQHVKDLYVEDKPEHFKILKSCKRISDREKEVALLLMQGHSTKSISEKLYISFNTVESHRKNLLQKLESKNTAELIHKLSYIPL